MPTASEPMGQEQSQSAARRASRLVWLLTGIGLAAGAAVLIIFGLALLQFRAARLEVDRAQSELATLVTRSQSLLSAGDSELASRLTGREAQEDQGDWLAELRQLIGDSKARVPDDEIAARLDELAARLDEIHDLREECRAWAESEDENARALRDARAETGGALHRIREDVASVEGRMDLQRVLKVRRFRAAEGEEAAALAREIVDELDASTGLSSLKAELADLALLGEQLVNESRIDGLTDLKDNRFTSTLARLRRELGRMTERSTDDSPIDAVSIDAYERALFGRGFVNDAAHQTIIPGEGGLYAACLAHVELTAERETLRELVVAAFASIQSIRQSVQEDAARLGSELSEQAEGRFVAALRNVILISLVIAVVFCALAAQIARTIRNQMRLLAETTAELRKANDRAQAEIADRRRAEAALAESEERSRLLLESTREGIFGVDTRGVVMFVNGSAAEMLGYARDEMLGQKVHSLIHHSHADGSPYPVEQCPMFRAYTEGANARVDDEVLWRKDGAKFDVEYTSVPIRKSEEIVGAVIVFHDITERKVAEAQLRKLSRAVEQSSSTVVITDARGDIEYANPKFTETTGYEIDEVLGQNPRVLNAEQQPKEFYEDLWKTIASGREWHGEFCNKKKSGELYWESASISPIRDAAGEVTHYVAVKDDITERKQMEEELHRAREAADDANRAKGDFLANMSHEIRTPMNGIIGMTELALDTELTPEQRDYLNTVQTSADALLTLINDILDFSKIEAGKLELDPIDFQLRDALADMLNALAARAHTKGLELAYHVPPDIHDALIGDIYRVRQVVVNLVGNAIKFTDTGEIVVAVEQIARSDEMIELHFSVRDTGVGIESDKLDAIFRPFEQADVSTTRKFGGTGLGLAISVQLVELMGGRIWAESRAGEGSTFHFTAVFGVGVAAPAVDAEQRRELLDGLSVLIVDDNATNRRILEEMLGNWRMAPQSAASAADGLAALDRADSAGSPFRLVLSDVNMPEMDGFQLFESTRSTPQHEHLPVILLTSASRPGDVARCREIGVAAHLIKPVKQSLLMNAIVNVVARQGVARAQAEVTPKTSEESGPARILRILLAEDNPTNQKFAVRAIEKAGHSVIVANNGREAVETWEGDSYDVVLMDVHMPEMDGLEATATIRDRERELGKEQRTPIIAMTANAMKGDRERCLDAGMDGYVSKPVKRDTLFTEIDRVLDASE